MGKKQKYRSEPATGLSLVSPTPSLPPLVETPAPKTVKLDLGCGQNPKEGFEGVDLYGDKATHKVDLWKFPWPFGDASVEEIHCSHFLEHIPAREVEEQDLAKHGTTWSQSDPNGGKIVQDRREQFIGQDMLFAFMDECWRILKPECWMTAIVPSGRSNRAFQDPTHRRFFMQETFLYFNAEWRAMNKLDHYRVKCNFGVEVPYSLPQEEGMRTAEVQAQRFANLWNTTIDWHAKLKKLPAP
jgi:predicted SAM-dependent methyltransferase